MSETAEGTKSLKQILLDRPDASVLETEVPGFSGVKVRVRRATVRERREIAARHQVGEGQAPKDPVGFGLALVEMCIEPKTSAEELLDLPGAFVDALSKLVMDFNGWSPRGAAETADQFPPKQ